MPYQQSDSAGIAQGFGSLGDMMMNYMTGKGNEVMNQAKREEMAAQTRLYNAQTDSADMDTEIKGIQLDAYKRFRDMGLDPNDAGRASLAETNKVLVMMGKDPKQFWGGMGAGAMYNEAERQTQQLPEGAPMTEGIGRLYMGAQGQKLGATDAITTGHAQNVWDADRKKAVQVADTKGRYDLAGTKYTADRNYEAKEYAENMKPVNIIDPMTGSPRIVEQKNSYGQRPEQKPLASSNLVKVVDKNGRIIRVRAEDAVGMEAAPSTPVTGDPFQRRIAGQDAKTIGEQRNLAIDADKSNLLLNQVGTAMQQMEEAGQATGKATPSMIWLKSWGRTLGMNVPEVASAEEFNSLAEQIVTKLGSTILKGQQTEAEWKMIRGLVMSLDKTPDANRRIMDIMRNINNRQRAYANEMLRYRERHGTLLDFENHWDANFAEKFGAPASHMAQTSAPAETPEASSVQGAQEGDLEVGAVLDGFRYLGGDPSSPESWEEE